MAERLQEGGAAWRDPEAVRLAVSGWVRESLEDLSDPDSGVFVAERDGEVVGFVCVSERAHFTGEVDAYIGELVVSKAAEGGGVGRALVGAAEDWGRARGRKRVVVDTGAANVPARRLCRSRLRGRRHHDQPSDRDEAWSLAHRRLSVGESRAGLRGLLRCSMNRRTGHVMVHALPSSCLHARRPPSRAIPRTGGACR
jgi:GNAT superfamily N-acetyltransferase